MIIKKLFAMLLAAVMLLSLAACAEKDDNKDDKNPSQDSSDNNGDTGTSDNDNNQDNSDADANGGETEDSVLATATMAELMEKVLDGAPELPFSLNNTELTQEAYEEILSMSGTSPDDYPFADWYKSFTFIDPIDGAEGICAEPMMTSVPFSVVLVRVPDGSDAETVAADMKANCDPRKWICVSADHVDAFSNGNLAILIMLGSTTDEDTTSQEQFDTIRDNFLALS